ncbi:MAG: 30S ribosome-binding factor RbfA [Limisphaerales bacterium]
MSSRRIERVNELLKHELGEILRRDFNLNDTGLLSVTAVETASDLRSARVFVSVLGTDDQRKLARRLLDEHRVRIQGEIGRNIVLKFTPTLTFLLDDSVAKADRVLRIIDDLERGGAGGAPGTAA